MNKHDIKRIFITQKECAKRLGISQQALSEWGEPLSDRQSNEVIGAAIRHGLHIPPDIIERHQQVESNRG